MASPVSCRNLNRRCLNSHMVRIVSVKSIMNMRRLALSCRWLSSANLSVATFSIGSLSPRLPTRTNAQRKDSNRTALDGLIARRRLRLESIVASGDVVTAEVGAVRENRRLCDEPPSRRWMTAPSAAAIKTLGLPVLHNKSGCLVISCTHVRTHTESEFVCVN